MESDSREVTLRVPARAEYVLLARLALSAVCRLTPLSPEEIADLKLAVTEAAAQFVGDSGLRRDLDPEEAGPAPEAAVEPRGAPVAGPEGELSFSFAVRDERLCLEVEGPPAGGLSDDEAALGRAVIEATVDDCEYRAGAVRLVKYLDVAAA